MASFRSHRRIGAHSVLLIVIFVMLGVGLVVGLIAVFGNKSAESSVSSEKSTLNESRTKSGSKPLEISELGVDEETAKQLQDTEFKFGKSGLRLRIPKGFSPSINPKLRPDFEGVTFRDSSTPDSEVPSAQSIYIQISNVPSEYWSGAISNLMMNIDRGSIPEIRRMGIEVTRRGGSRECTIGGIKFMRQEAEGKTASGRVDRYVFYCGASKPYLIEARCHCTPDRVEDLLQVLEASIWSLKR